MWCLYALTQAPEVQRKLREELRTLDTDKLTMDELSALPYLDAVVRETLRLHSPATFTLRTALADDVLPVSAPFRGRDGALHAEIGIKRGDRVVVPSSLCTARLRSGARTRRSGAPSAG